MAKPAHPNPAHPSPTQRSPARHIPVQHGDTRIGEQPSLRTSSGRSWLIVGALMTVISVGVLFAVTSQQPLIGFLGAGIIAVLFALMVVVSLVVRHLRARLVTLAVLLAAIAATALAFMFVIAAAEWSVVG